eukprot:1750626-Pyramimonas_sp.AAC.1
MDLVAGTGQEAGSYKRRARADKFELMSSRVVAVLCIGGRGRRTPAAAPETAARKMDDCGALSLRRS